MLLYFIVVAVCAVAGVADAAFQPSLALFDAKLNETLSITTWRNVDLGLRSTIYAGPNPARLFALHAIVNFSNYGTEEKRVLKVKKFLFLIPFCTPFNSSSDAAPKVDSCSLLHFGGTILLRFRGGWESHFVSLLRKDSVLGPTNKEAVRRFISVTGGSGGNNSNLTFPFPIEGTASSNLPFFGGGPRHDAVQSCNELIDECVQASSFRYTDSYKNIPLESFSGRIIHHPHNPLSWNTPWLLRISAALPPDSACEVDILVVLRTPADAFHFRMWLTGSVTGSLFLLGGCLCIFFSFVIGTKELGVRLWRAVPLEGRQRTVLFEEVEGDDLPCFPILRILAALRRAGVEVWTELLLPTLRTLLERIRRLFRRSREDEGVILISADEETLGAGNTREGGTRGTLAQGTDGNNNNNNNNSVDDDDDDGDDGESGDLCRICRCTDPVEDLFSPCACDGTSKYVHRQCLEKWRNTTTNVEHRRVCAECKTPYTLVLECVPLSPYGSARHPVCVPTCCILLSYVMRLFLILVVFCLGGYYLKVCMYIATGFDGGILWSFHHFYHWVLGLYFVIAFCVNLIGLEYVLRDFPKAWQQLLILLISVGVVEIPLNYVGQFFVLMLCSTDVQLEVSYGVGILTASLFYSQVLPSVYEGMESLLGVREVVAPRNADIV
ncbi:hypothetical protein, conserved [Trypanosoma brucei brucei TREU927]|uniref:RING-CH-type domain-containing protein n=1 Tax=Trypanosoma brucei brucei (strain 927/4 GUTat10.1) TaxID=185431 RepID=Q57WV4_TRYB2|nr:hypothetical protein, conserved [Trypanosoma brucei brucei TREU927]AAX69914.1 hypothetical protein, conserved [Trypanosoma brucei]AAZ10108.1 hypothetical protein, conserved [Trypanosoma brucei brucei TREU927]